MCLINKDRTLGYIIIGIILLLGIVPIVYGALSPSFSSTVWQVPTFKADFYFLGTANVTSILSGLWGNTVIEADTASIDTLYITNPIINGTGMAEYVSNAIDTKRLYPQSIADGEASGLFSSMIVGESVVIGDVLYINTDGKLYKADASVNTTLPAIAIALETISSNNVGNVLNSGYLKNTSWSWSTGKILYLSTATGDITQTKPTGTNLVQAIGYAYSSSIIYFNPSMLIVTGATTSGGGGTTPPPSGLLTITIDQTKIDETLTNFPVLISLGSTSPIFSELAYATRYKFNVTTVANVDCYVEIESWTDTPDSAILWVRVPSISATQDTILYLNYGSGMADNTSYVGLVGSVPAETVWSNSFVGVWHLDETGDGTVGEYKDSSSDNNNGRAGIDVDGVFTAADVPTTGTGLIGNAPDFDGTSDRLVIPDSSDYSIITTGYLSVGFWVRLDDIDQASYQWWQVLGKGDYTGATGAEHHEWNIVFYNNSTNVTPYPGRQQRRSAYAMDKDSGYGSGNYAQPGYNYAGDIPLWDVGDWACIVGQWGGPEANHVYIYNGPGILGHAGVNYVLGEGASGNTIQLQDATGPFFVGTYDPEHQGAPTYHDGIIDEVRIANTVRSVAWIKADYYNQLNSLVTIVEP